MDQKSSVLCAFVSVDLASHYYVAVPAGKRLTQAKNRIGSVPLPIAFQIKFSPHAPPALLGSAEGTNDCDGYNLNARLTHVHACGVNPAPLAVIIPRRSIAAASFGATVCGAGMAAWTYRNSFD